MQGIQKCLFLLVPSVHLLGRENDRSEKYHYPGGGSREKIFFDQGGEMKSTLGLIVAPWATQEVERWDLRAGWGNLTGIIYLGGTEVGQVKTGKNETTIAGF
jgi:hypothetical protein